MDPRRAHMPAPAERRLVQLSKLLCTSPAAGGGEERGEGEDEDEGLRSIPWSEIAQHSTLDDLWIVVDGVVYDMTEFIQGGDHPGGEDIPLEYGGKDASLFWDDVHGHLRDEILVCARLTSTTRSPTHFLMQN